MQSAIYNTQQAKNAIGSGGLFGSGIGHGAQTNLGYVPEQQTDFIFTAVAEQLGFVGAVGVLVLLGVIAWRVLHAAVVARDTFGRLICAGLFAFIAFSVFQNAGMTMGIMPITGYPAPVRQLRRDGGAGLLRRRRPGPERRRPAEIPVTDLQPGSRPRPRLPSPRAGPARRRGPEATRSRRPRRHPIGPSFRVMDVEDVVPRPALAVPLRHAGGVRAPDARRSSSRSACPRAPPWPRPCGGWTRAGPMTHELFMQVLQRARIDVIARAPGRARGGQPPGRARPDDPGRPRADRLPAFRRHRAGACACRSRRRSWSTSACSTRRATSLPLTDDAESRRHAAATGPASQRRPGSDLIGA